MDVLKVEGAVQEDNSIISQQPFPFNPITGTQYNNAGIIQINIENQAEYLLPSQSWLQIDGRLFKENDQPYVLANDNVAMINNAPMYCFSNIKYHLGGNEIESINEPGQATTMMGLLKYERTFPGLNQCWTIDTALAADDTNAGFVKRKNFILSSALLVIFHLHLVFNTFSDLLRITIKLYLAYVILSNLIARLVTMMQYLGQMVWMLEKLRFQISHGGYQEFYHLLWKALD